MAMIERAMSLFTPFYQPPDGGAPRPAENVQEEVAALRDEVDNLRRQLAEAQKTQAPQGSPTAQAEPAKKAG